MKKQIALLLVSITLLGQVFCHEYKKQFIKGNITDKTNAVREASGGRNLAFSKSN